MIIYNGYRDGERRVQKHRTRKADAGHSMVESITQRRGSDFSFRYTLVCECGWTASSKQSSGPLGYRHDAHQREMARKVGA